MSNNVVGRRVTHVATTHVSHITGVVFSCWTNSYSWRRYLIESCAIREFVDYQRTTWTQFSDMLSQRCVILRISARVHALTKVAFWYFVSLLHALLVVVGLSFISFLEYFYFWNSTMLRRISIIGWACVVQEDCYAVSLYGYTHACGLKCMVWKRPRDLYAVIQIV